LNNVPLLKQPYIYTGKDRESYKNGETYYVIETGYHWIKELGYVVWMTNEEYKDTTDIDYGVSMSVGDFHNNFWKP
jgi:hypothetical protein